MLIPSRFDVSSVNRLTSPFLVACLCSVGDVPRFLSGLTNISGLAVAAFVLVYYSLSFCSQLRWVTDEHQRFHVKRH